jgi:hypothetical protein
MDDTRKKYLVIAAGDGAFVVHLTLKDCEDILKLETIIKDLSEPHSEMGFTEIVYSLGEADYLRQKKYPFGTYLEVVDSIPPDAEPLEELQVAFNKYDVITFRSMSPNTDFTIMETMAMDIHLIRGIRDTLLPNSVNFINNLKEST